MHQQQLDAEGTAMSINNDYVTNVVVRQHHQDLIAQAEADRLARTIRGKRPHWLRRLFGTRVPAAPPEPQPIAPVEEQADSAPAEDRVPVGAGRINGS